MVVPCPIYGWDGCNFKLILQIFFYNILANNNSRGFAVDFDMVLSEIQVDKERHNLADKPKYESTNKSISGLWGPLGNVLVSSGNNFWGATVRVIILNVFQSLNNFKERVHI